MNVAFGKPTVLGHWPQPNPLRGRQHQVDDFEATVGAISNLQFNQYIAPIAGLLVRL